MSNLFVMGLALECVVCGSRWISARFHSRDEDRREGCPECGGPLVRPREEPIVRIVGSQAQTRRPPATA